VRGSVSARIARESGSSFYYAFRILPGEKRRAIYALYAFCRVVDDCVDEPGGEGAAGLERWLREVDLCYAGRPETGLGADLADALARFPIPRRSFQEIVDGCRMDLADARYATWPELRAYCEKVASAVGLGAIEIFGYRDPRTREYAVELGVALQLTNILRDVAGDAARGRLYVPQEDLARFGVQEAELLRPEGVPRAEVHRLMSFEAERARGRYAAADALLPPGDARSLASAQVMGAVYREQLELLARHGFPVSGPRLRLSRARKLWIAARTLARVHSGRVRTAP
jgi:15-cis-phytoene synthase